MGRLTSRPKLEAQGSCFVRDFVSRAINGDKENLQIALPLPFAKTGQSSPECYSAYQALLAEGKMLRNIACLVCKEELGRYSDDQIAQAVTGQKTCTCSNCHAVHHMVGPRMRDLDEALSRLGVQSAQTKRTQLTRLDEDVTPLATIMVVEPKGFIECPHCHQQIDCGSSIFAPRMTVRCPHCRARSKTKELDLEHEGLSGAKNYEIVIPHRMCGTNTEGKRYDLALVPQARRRRTRRRG